MANDRTLVIPNTVTVDRVVSKKKVGNKLVSPTLVTFKLNFSKLSPEDLLKMAVNSAIIQKQTKIRSAWNAEEAKDRHVPKKGEVFEYTVKLQGPKVVLTKTQATAKIFSSMTAEEQDAWLEEMGLNRLKEEVPPTL